MDTREETSIAAFLQAYNAAAGTGYSVVRKPDATNRSQPDVDAIAECPGHPPLAIEHTTVETHPGQRDVWQRFRKYIVPLQTELGGVFPFCFDLVVPDTALVVGKDWTALATSIKRTFLEVAGDLPTDRAGVAVPVGDTHVLIRKRESDRRDVFVMRSLPPGTDLAALMDQGMHKALDHAHSKFAPYRRTGATNIVLLESYDLASINEDILKDAADRSMNTKVRPDVDQVWFAWIIGDDCEIFCLVGPDDLRTAANELTYARLRSL